MLLATTKLTPCYLARVRQVWALMTSDTQRVAFAILCAQAITPLGSIPGWERWAQDWLSGADRSSAAAAAAIISAAVSDIATALTYAAAAAFHIAYATETADAYATESYVSFIADARDHGARTAARAVAHSIRAIAVLNDRDLAAIAEQAMTYKEGKGGL